MMALDAKAIKEEVLDKDMYESNARRVKGKDRCRTPDSPESVQVMDPKSPISPQHHSSLAPPRSNRNGSSSPIVNGSTTPPPTSTATTQQTSTPSLLQDSGRAVTKVKKFLGALVQFSQDTSPDRGDRVRALILSLASGGLTSDEFKVALQEATNFPLRPHVLPFLKTHIPYLQRDIAGMARSCNLSTLQYVRTNENSVFENTHATEHSDIFLPIEVSSSNGGTTVNGNGVILKRRTSDSLYENQSVPTTEAWNDYLLPAKRPHLIVNSNAQLFTSQPPLFDYHSGGAHIEPFTSILEKGSQRDDREIRGSIGSDSQRNNRSSGGGEDEWKNIHTMLNCISAMVDKTKRAITILQQRVVETPHQSYAESSFAEMKRQTEEKVTEFRRNAEEAVNQVKRQAVIEIQRAVSTAESRAVEMIAQERIKMFSELSKNNSDDNDNQTAVIPIPGSTNVCWNCGRKANETCSGCNLARYCGAFCQHKDWEQHHQICSNNRIETTSTAKVPPHFRGAVPPARTSPNQQNVNITNGGISSVGLK
ncbi:protein CBFA2T2 isoform X1 [Bradysia coprophila]|uniref:protein CBFA2T2 isoform X1 n=2 Tax=Bradysia coprophila TaxID=38358 RepID=UPI00187DAE52|nr:protein CBFA2T2 isoform X1 [Bradysia coprophila]